MVLFGPFASSLLLLIPHSLPFPSRLPVSFPSPYHSSLFPSPFSLFLSLSSSLSAPLFHLPPLHIFRRLTLPLPLLYLSPSPSPSSPPRFYRVVLAGRTCATMREWDVTM